MVSKLLVMNISFGKKVTITHHQMEAQRYMHKYRLYIDTDVKKCTICSTYDV